MDGLNKKISLLAIASLCAILAILLAVFGGFWVTTAEELSRLRAENAAQIEQIETLARTVGERDKTIKEMEIETENLNSLFGIAVRNSAPAPNSAAVDAMAARMVVDDMRNLKSAALMFYVDELKFPTSLDAVSLDKYLASPFLTGAWRRYPSLLSGSAVDSLGGTRDFIGLKMDENTCTEGVQSRLANYAKKAGLWQINGRAADIYSGGLDIYLAIR